jgi:phospholipid/cholesterol/gamma-HCH transport system substrate-binding protein
MNQAQMNARVGIFFLIGIVIIWITFQALHDNSFTAKDGYRVTAAFQSVRELKIGNEVRMAGVPIGVVSAVNLSGDHATATLLIRKEFTIARDATATIAMSGLIGSNYISLDFGAPSTAGTVPTDNTGALRTRDVPDLNDLMTQLGGVGDDLKVAIKKIGSAFDENPDGAPGLVKNLNNLVTENRSDLKSTITNLNEITAQIRGGQGTLGKLINDPAAYDQLLAAVTEIKSAATEAKGFLSEAQAGINGILADVKSGRGTIGALIYDETTASNLKLSIKNITDITTKMNNDQSSFGQLISNDALVRDAKATLRKVDRAVDGISDSGPITAAGLLFKGLW